MIVEINVEYLYEYEVSTSQLLYLGLCTDKKFNTADKLIHKNKITTEEIQDLKKKGFIIGGLKDPLESSELIFSKNKLGELFKVDNKEYFWELFSTYPIKVNSNRGQRILRPKSLEAKETKECKKKYERYLGKTNAKEKHRHVMNCLEAELLFRKRNNSMGFMRAFTTWLNKQEWYSYESLVDLANTTKKEEGYGEKLI